MESIINIKAVRNNAHRHKKTLERKSIKKLSEKEISSDIFTFEIKRNNELVFKDFYREGIRQFLINMGFHKRSNNGSYYFIREVSNVVEVVDEITIKETLFKYISSFETPLHIKFNKASLKVEPAFLVETFQKRQHLLINSSTLDLLPTHEKEFLRDDRDFCYFLFKNKVVQIKGDSIRFLGYEDLENKCVWKEQIIGFEFTYQKENKSSHFASFILNVANQEDDRKKAFHSAIGYLLHNFSKSSDRKAIICYDEELTDLHQPQGGTGKSLFANGIKQCRKTVRVDGKAFNANDQFCFQDVNEDTQMVWIDDNRADFDFQRLNSIITEGLIGRKLFKANFHIPAEIGPKFLICSNTIINGSGTTFKRRQFSVEFSNFYSSKIKTGTEEPIISEHGCEFFNWSTEENNKFYSFMIDCAQFYLKTGLCTYEKRNIQHNKVIQELGSDFYEWIQNRKLEFDQEHDVKGLFDDFKRTYFGEDEKFSQRRFTTLIKKYCSIMEYEFSRRATNGTTYIKVKELKN